MIEQHVYTCDQKLKWWGYGEWVEEYDEVYFEYKNYQCKILRIVVPEKGVKNCMFGGHLCGYVKVPFPISEDLIKQIKCHGGINFCDDEYIGFDCAHFCDMTPSYIKRNDSFLENIKPINLFRATYKNVYYCREQCKYIVDQLIDLFEAD